MKIAVTGKGGVGKTSFAATLTRICIYCGIKLYRVYQSVLNQANAYDIIR